VTGKRAILVTDVQRDFCAGGSLVVPGGDTIASRLSRYLADHAGDYRVVVATRDWHVNPGKHFAPPGTEPDFVDIWPAHCVAGTAGAEYHPALRLPAGAVEVRKGERRAAYSGFDGHDAGGTSLLAILRDADIQEVDVVGLAESHCVRDTAVDAAGAGFATTVLNELTAGVSPETTDAARREMASAGVRRRSVRDLLAG
jgi:nicotinamidase/pyrazinamidase